MAIITEHEDQPPSPSKPKSKPKPKSNSSQTQKSSPKPRNPNPNPFTFWFYFTIFISLITFLFISLSSFSTPDPKSWFLNLPTTLRAHYSLGRPIKVQLNPNEPPIQVFTYSKGSKSSEIVLIVHGLGCSSFSFRKVIDDLANEGLFGVAVDLPGFGFSDKTVLREREVDGGGLSGLIEVYQEIKEKGIFWGFDNLIEHGSLPYQEGKTRVSKKKVVVEAMDFGSVEFGSVLGQVIDSLGLGPLHLVLHDSALNLGANWVVENSRLLRSLTLVDTMPKGMALPLWALDVPVVREVLLGVDSVFGRVLSLCCSRALKGSSLEAHRVLLKGRDGWETVVGIGRKLNQSFDLGEWAKLKGVKSLPMQVLWSSSWSQEWSEEGKRVAKVVSQAKFFEHSGGRWPEDETSSELAEKISQLVASLPKTERMADDEPVPEHIQKLLDEAKSGSDHHHHDHGHSHHDGHSHDHGAHAGYMDAYGLGNGHGWGM